MSEYKTIFGKAVKALASDPTDTGAEGQIWYNTTTGSFRTVLATGAWISTSPLNTARESAGGAGIQTAAMVFGGRNEVDGPPTGGPNAQYNLNEEYNGTGYSTGGALVQGRQSLSGAGTQTAGLGVGGYHPPAPGPKSLVEEYDGSTWSEVNDIPTGTFGMGSAGTQTAAVVTGGRTAGGWVASTYEYDGTNWTSGGALGTARTLKGAMTGTLTAALAVGGDLNPPGGATNKVEEYNGTAWTEVNSYPTNINVNMVSGIQTSALSFGGNIPPYTTNAFTYDGTNFTATASMGSSASGQNTLKTATNNLTGLSMGGYGTSSYIATSEEYNFSASVITPAAWSSGANLPTAVFRNAAFGTLTAAVSTGGSNNPPQALPATTSSFEYDGSAWTSGGALNTARRSLGASGEQTSGLAFGGEINPGAGSGATESYDGASWTSVNSMNTAREAFGGDGTQTDSLIAGGLTTVNVNITETWDGTNWTAAPATLNTTRRGLGVSGDSAAAVGFAGETTPGAQLASSEDYNGTVWTAGNPTNVPSATVGAAGTAATALKFGGRNPSPVVSTEGYDGTSWSTRPNMATGRMWVGGTGTQTAALAAGGEYTSNPISNVVEEFTGETTALNYKTITTS